MPRRSLLALALTLALPSLRAVAQEAPPKVGLGVAIVPDLFVARKVEVYVPISVSPQLRIEPESGIFTTSSTPGSATSIILGSGIFYLFRAVHPVDLYAGGRVKIAIEHLSAGGASSSGTDFYLLGALGGEVFLASRFSLGLEAQFGLRAMSAEGNTIEGNGNNSSTDIFSNGLGFLRMYF